MNALQVQISPNASEDAVFFALDLLTQLDCRGIELHLSADLAGLALLEDFATTAQQEVLRKLMHRNIADLEPQTNLLFFGPVDDYKPIPCRRSILFPELDPCGTNCICSGFEQFDSFIACSDFARYILQERCRVPASKISILPTALDKRIFNPQASPCYGDTPASLKACPLRFITRLDLNPEGGFSEAFLLFARIAQIVGVELCSLMVLGQQKKPVAAADFSQYIQLTANTFLEHALLADLAYQISYFPAPYSPDLLPHIIRAGTHYITLNQGAYLDLLALRAAAAGVLLIVPNHTFYNATLSSGPALLVPVEEASYKVMQEQQRQLSPPVLDYALGVLVSHSSRPLTGQEANGWQYAQFFDWGNVIEDYLSVLLS